MDRRLGLAAALAAGLAMLALAGCGRHSIRPPCPAGKLCFEAGNDTDPVSLDPPKTQLAIEQNILEDLLVGLTTSGPDGKPTPGMAKSWTVSPDGLVWTFKLRDALWSDGAPVTAQDFVFSFRRLEDPRTASEYAYLFYLIRDAKAVNDGKAPPAAIGVTAPDPRTVQITLEHPAPYMPQLLSHMIVMPVPEHVVRRWGDAWSEPGHYVSNGPYVLQSWKLGDHIRLVKNPRFYDAAHVCLDVIDYYPTPDAVSAERRVRRGELDMNNGIQSNRVAYLRRPDQIPAYVHSHPWLGVSYLVFNPHDTPVLRDIRVRKALVMSIDREFITGKLLRAGQPPLYTFVPPGTANYPGVPPPAWSRWPFDRRKAEAARLLAQAGYSLRHPLRLHLKYPGAGQGSVMMAALQADWRTIGVDVELDPVEGQIFFNDLNDRDFQLGIAGWVADFNDPLTFLDLLKSDAGPQNYGDYHNPAYDALLDQADHEADAVKRGRVLARAEQIALDDVAVGPIYGYVSLNLINPHVTGWIDNIVNFNPKRFLCFSDAAARRRATGAAQP